MAWLQSPRYCTIYRGFSSEQSSSENRFENHLKRGLSVSLNSELKLNYCIFEWKEKTQKQAETKSCLFTFDSVFDWRGEFVKLRMIESFAPIIIIYLLQSEATPYCWYSCCQKIQYHIDEPTFVQLNQRNNISEMKWWLFIVHLSHRRYRITIVRNK